MREITRVNEIAAFNFLLSRQIVRWRTTFFFVCSYQIFFFCISNR